MSKVQINEYYNNIQRATQYGKSKNETAIRNHTWNLLNNYAHKETIRSFLKNHITNIINQYIYMSSLISIKFLLTFDLLAFS
jgi:hypothetical protein